MIRSPELRAAGIPAVPGIIAMAMKAANIAEHSGCPKDEVLAFVHRIAHAEALPAGSEDLQERFADVIRALSDQPSLHRDFTPRETAAPWKKWGALPLDETTLQQMRNACDLPVTVGGALMPDAHAGYGLPIGGVLAVRDAVIPYAVGVDIACRMRITVLDMAYEDFARDYAPFREAIEAETRFGVGASFELWKLRQHAVMEDPAWNLSPVTEKLRGKAAVQLGTSGGGNHFVEFGKLTVSEDTAENGFALPAGRYVALLSHSGSRGTGEAVANHYSTLAMSLHPNMPDRLKHLAWLDLNSQDGQEYWGAMELMGRYASANHELIHGNILRHLGVSALGMVENHHNFAWKEQVEGEELVIHRKGATPAHKGRLGIIPGSMGTPGFVVRGKGSAESFNSCSHGAGRAMSRKAAFQNLTEEQMKDFLKERNVTLISGALDESPMAYKDIESVIGGQGDLVEILARFEPRLVKMAPGEETRPYWMKRKRKP